MCLEWNSYQQGQRQGNKLMSATGLTILYSNASSLHSDCSHFHLLVKLGLSCHLPTLNCLETFLPPHYLGPLLCIRSCRDHCCSPTLVCIYCLSVTGDMRGCSNNQSVPFDERCPQQTTLVLLLLAVYMIMTHVLLLNLLIAMFR